MNFKKIIISAIILIACSFGVLFLKNTWALTNAKDVIGDISDCFMAPGIIYVCFGIIVICSNKGAFDMLSYGIQTAFSVFKKDPTERKYQNFGDYRLAKQDKKSPVAHFMLCGGIYMALGLVFYIIYAIL